MKAATPDGDERRSVRAQRRRRREPETAVRGETLESLNTRLLTWPQGFKAHPRLAKTLERRRDAIHSGAIDWGHAEALAFGSLLLDGIGIRISGQDAERGTFAHRHAVLHDVETGGDVHAARRPAAGAGHVRDLQQPALRDGGDGVRVRLQHGGAGRPRAVGSAVRRLRQRRAADHRPVHLGRPREVGDSGAGSCCCCRTATRAVARSTPARGSSGSSSSAPRGTWCVAYPSTPAQYFHILRRQALRADRTPLILMQPKSLLRLPAAMSRLEELAAGGFQPVIDDARDGESARRRAPAGAVHGEDVLRSARGEAAGARTSRWCGWTSCIRGRATRWRRSWTAIRTSRTWCGRRRSRRTWARGATSRRSFAWRRGTCSPIRYIGRPERASPAEGYSKAHEEEQKRIVTEVLQPRAVDRRNARHRRYDESDAASRPRRILVLAAPRLLSAQERGAVALGEAVAGLDVTARVLMIGAHPDDEDTQLITWLARGAARRDGVSLADARRRRPEPDRQRARAAARHDPHRGAARGAAARRRTAVLHARVRLRLLQDGRRDVHALGEGLDPARRRDGGARLPAADHRRGVQRARRATDTGTIRCPGSSRAKRSTRRRTRCASRAARRSGLGAWTPPKFYRAQRFNPAEATLSFNVGELSPFARDDVRRDRVGEPVAAPVAGVRRAAAARDVAGLPQARGVARLAADRAGEVDVRDAAAWGGVALRRRRAASRRARGTRFAAGGDRRRADAWRTSPRRRRWSRRWRASCGLLARARAGLTCAERSARLGASACDGDLALSLETAERRAQRALLSAAGVLVEATAPRELLAVHDTLPVTVTVYNQGKSDVVLEGASVWMQNVYWHAAGGTPTTIAPDSAGRITLPLVSQWASVAVVAGERIPDAAPTCSALPTAGSRRRQRGDRRGSRGRHARAHRAAHRGRVVRVRRRPRRVSLRRSGARRAASARRVGAGDQPACSTTRWSTRASARRSTASTRCTSPRRRARRAA